MPRLGRIRLVLGAVILLGIAPPSIGAQAPVPALPPLPDEPMPAVAPRDDIAIRLEVPSPRPNERPLPINLATALRLSADRPLVVAAAQASALVAQAELERANVLWVPTLNTGFNYYRHDGGIQNLTTGQLATVSSNFLYAGGGINLIVATTDAIFVPLAARQVLSARRFDIQTAKNEALLETATAYFTVHEKRGAYASALETVERARDLVSRIEKLGVGLVPKAEADRARTLLADLEQQAAAAHADWRISGAALTRVLRLDPTATVVPLEPDHLAITLIDDQQEIDELIVTGLTNRPELASQQALVQAALARLKQERLRPLLPSVLITGFQTPEFLFNGGVFGAGSGDQMNQWSGRYDMSYQLVWQLEGLGAGNRARIRERQGNRLQALVELFRVQDQIAAQVVEAQALVESARIRKGEAERGLREALITYDANLRGLGETTRSGDLLILIYRPQEVVVALQNLQAAYLRYFSTVADYNRAQFRLFYALGYPAQGLAYERPPGPIVPVDTARPGYLPPVELPPLPR